MSILNYIFRPFGLGKSGERQQKLLSTGYSQPGDTLESFEADPDAFDKIKDWSVFTSRFSLLVGELFKYEWTIDGSQEVKDYLENTKNLEDLFYFVSEMFVVGKSVIRWDPSTKEFDDIHPNFVSLSYAGDAPDGNKIYKWVYTPPTTDKEPRPLNPKTESVCTYKKRTRSLKSGEGVLDTIASLKYDWDELRDTWFKFLNRFGTPYLLYQYDPEIIDAEKDLNAVLTNILSTLASNNKNKIITASNKEKLEFIEAQSKGEGLIQGFSDIRKQVEEVVCFASLAMTIDDARGSYGAVEALGKNKDVGTILIRKSCARQLTHGVVRQIWEYLGRPVDDGWKEGKEDRAPEFKFLIPDPPLSKEQSESAKMRLEVAQLLKLPLTNQTVYDTLRFDMPEDTDPDALYEWEASPTDPASVETVEPIPTEEEVVEEV